MSFSSDDQRRSRTSIYTQQAGRPSKAPSLGSTCSNCGASVECGAGYSCESCCNKTFCLPCVISHTRAGHVVKDPEGFPPPMCCEHSEICGSYCLDCEQPLCHFCKPDHCKHDVKEIRQLACAIREEMAAEAAKRQAALEAVECRRSQLEEFINEHRRTLCNLKKEAGAEAMLENVKSYVECLHKTYDTEINGWLEKIETFAAEMDDAIRRASCHAESFNDGAELGSDMEVIRRYSSKVCEEPCRKSRASRCRRTRSRSVGACRLGDSECDSDQPCGRPRRSTGCSRTPEPCRRASGTCKTKCAPEPCLKMRKSCPEPNNLCGRPSRRTRVSYESCGETDSCNPCSIRTSKCSTSKCPDPCQKKCPDPCEKKCPDPCGKKCPDPCEKKCPDPCEKKCPDPCDQKCPDPCEKKCPDPCEKKCPDPCEKKCPDPCENKCPDPCSVKSKCPVNKVCGNPCGDVDPCDPCAQRRRKSSNCDPCGRKSFTGGASRASLARNSYQPRASRTSYAEVEEDLCEQEEEQQLSSCPPPCPEPACPPPEPSCPPPEPGCPPTETLECIVDSIINQLQRSNFCSFARTLSDLDFRCEEQARYVADGIVEAAAAEPCRAELLANFTRTVILMRTRWKQKTVDPVLCGLRRFVLANCERQYNSFRDQVVCNQNACEGVGAQNPEALALIIFFGELFNLSFLTNNVMHDCISTLTQAGDEASLLTLADLMSRVGRKLDQDRRDVSKRWMDEYFDWMCSKSGGCEVGEEVASRFREVIDLRSRGWPNFSQFVCGCCGSRERVNGSDAPICGLEQFECNSRYGISCETRECREQFGAKTLSKAERRSTMAALGSRCGTGCWFTMEDGQECCPGEREQQRWEDHDCQLKHEAKLHRRTRHSRYAEQLSPRRSTLERRSAYNERMSRSPSRRSTLSPYRASLTPRGSRRSTSPAATRPSYYPRRSSPGLDIGGGTSRNTYPRNTIVEPRQQRMSRLYNSTTSPRLSRPPGSIRPSDTYQQNIEPWGREGRNSRYSAGYPERDSVQLRASGAGKPRTSTGRRSTTGLVQHRDEDLAAPENEEIRTNESAD